MRALAVILALGAFAHIGRAQERLGFHVRAWVQWDDQRIELGDGQVGGPYGLGFTVLARLEGTTVTVRFRPEVRSDSTVYGASVETRIAVSDSGSTTPLYAIDRYYRSVSVQRGAAAQLTLPYHPEPNEAAELTLRIEGPFEPRPADSLGWMQRVISEPRSVYYRNVAYKAALAVTPDVCPGALAVRLAQEGSQLGIEVLACGGEATPVAIPGVAGSWIVMIPSTPAPRPAARCLSLNEPPPAGIRNFHPRSWAAWCSAADDPWRPVPVRLSTGEQLRARLLP